MERVKSEVLLISRPSVDWPAVTRYLELVGGQSWLERVSESGSPDAEMLIEFMGRLCYRSWAPNLNPNVHRVREDSDAYLTNILASGHGSVLEHVNYSFVFLNVSRVFTHELVRHRAGTAVSQESMRYVRLTDIPFEHPRFVSEDAELLQRAAALLADMESFQELVAVRQHLDDADIPFAVKKEITSGARRYAPEGVATSVAWTANVRALRHIIALRTDVSAEVEIRSIFARVAEIMRFELPTLFSDFTVDEDGAWVPQYRKV